MTRVVITGVGGYSPLGKDLNDVLNVLKSKQNRIVKVEELSEYNFGYNFMIQDSYPYRDIVGENNPNKAEVYKNLGLKITTLDELFNEFYVSNPHLLFIVEIKNSQENSILENFIFLI